AFLIEAGTGIGVTGVGRRPVIHGHVVVAAGQDVLVPPEHVVHREAPAGQYHDRQVEASPVEATGQAPDPLGERGPQDHAVLRVDLAVVVLVDDPNVAGLATVALHLHGIGGLPDAAELVVVVDRDGLTDEPLVP